MRIGYITYGLDRSPTGIGRYAMELLASLRRLAVEHEIVVLTTEKHVDDAIVAGLEAHPVPLCRTLPALMTIGNPIIGALVQRLNLDLVHDPNGIAPFIALPNKVPAMLTLHDAFPFVHPETHNRLDNWRYRWYLPVALRNTARVVTVSQTSKTDLCRHLGLDGNRVSVISEGVHPRFSPRSDSAFGQNTLDRYGIRPPYLLYVGALNGRKNVARMLEAYRIARQQHPEYTLVIAGKRQWTTDSIDRTMASAELQDSVHFTGYVDDEDLPELYRSATAFLFPSLYEGFGLPPLEAMACGTPVITSNISSLPEVVGSAALLVDPLDVQEIAQAITRVLDEPGLRQAMRDKGLSQARHFSWDTSATQTIELYERARTGQTIENVERITSTGEESVNAD